MEKAELSTHAWLTYHAETSGPLRTVVTEMKQFVLVHNIPSPYRLFLFDVLASRLHQRNVDLLVHFMAKGHHDRPKDWESALGMTMFEHSFWWDCGPSISGKKWHFNPGLLRWLMRNRPEFLMVGGPWDSLTGVAASLFARRKKGICWGEGNTQSPGNLGAGLGEAKRFLLRRFDVFAVPGADGEKLARMIVGATGSRPRIVMLPNIVDDSKFKTAEKFCASTLKRMRMEFGVADDERLALWPARLIHNKGIPDTLRLLDPEALRGWRIVLLGDGPQRDEVLRLIAQRGLTSCVSLHSPIAYGDMPAAYACADLFMLPSLQDPNPLSVVEALHSGLPILVSNRIGNLPEALQEHSNGWVFDPANPAAAKATFASAFTCPINQLQAMGQASKRIASGFWATTRAVEAFLDAVPVE